MCDAHRIPHSGHLTALEMAKVYIRSNFADFAVGIEVKKREWTVVSSKTLTKILEPSTH